MFQKFKKFKKFQVVFFITLASLVTFATFVFAGIANTRHDLSASGTGSIKALSATEKCVFCHTPHGGPTGIYPLWNHAMSNATYTVLGAPGANASRIVQPGQPDGGSKLCLSCHDGTVAIGMARNTPGRGSIYPTAITMVNVTASGYMPPAATGYIGTDLTAKHMVSIEFDDGLENEKLARCADGRASMALADPTALQIANGQVKLWPTGHNNGYTPDTPGSISARLGVQCRSCHDPHESTTKCFLVPVPGITCATCPCTVGNYDALCDKCHYPCP